MKIQPDKINRLTLKIESLITELRRVESYHQDRIKNVHPAYQQSARNLIHYTALRSFDITNLQRDLGNLGLSRIARAEAHVLASLQNCRFILKTLIKENLPEKKSDSITLKKARKLIRSHSKNLLGYRSKGRRVRIMVTLPRDAAYNYSMVRDLLRAGMNTARINCAHDNPEVWKGMIENILRANENLKKNCRISMDLAGPKIRTASIQPHPGVIRFRPKKNTKGQVIRPCEIFLVGQLQTGGQNELPVEEKWLQHLEPGDIIRLRDTRNKKRTLLVMSIEPTRVVATCSKTIYLMSGIILTIERTGLTTKVQELPPLEQAIKLHVGDSLRITKEKVPGKPAEYDHQGMLKHEAFVACTSTEIFHDVKKGERIIFDDGKIQGLVSSVDESGMWVKITQAKQTGSLLRADKGINLPDTNLRIKGLTAKDREDLKFIVENADVVNVSFVNSKEDVKELLSALAELGSVNKLGIILKIETKNAFNNLKDILLEGMKVYPLGVMIARGDLAIESGWENMARIQREILSLANAAHVPDIWATQVLETLAKKGIPSRSEISDVATALDAECVMLNKGPYILEAVHLLDQILRGLNKYQNRNEKLTPILEIADSHRSPKNSN